MEMRGQRRASDGLVMLPIEDCQINTWPKSTGVACNGGVTFVTALYDIGRGNWTGWARGFDTYLHHFSVLLKANITLYIFCDDKVAHFVRRVRTPAQETFVHTLPFEDLEFQGYKQHINQVLRSEEFRKDNDMLHHPECFSSDYIILMNNKISFLNIARAWNPFKTSHFYWIDAGYGHGSVEFPKNCASPWKPEKLLLIVRKITYIQLANLTLYQNKTDLHKVRRGPALSGGFFGGDLSAIAEYYHLYRKVFRACLVENIVDDDQSMALYAYFEYPILFKFEHGRWFDAVELFS
ncbi:protein HtrL-like [Ylistrum balloti]|uniref:protein HtrL-like n=1 Tax=Ylistrum balloti TaxID=509963 RepID=UPI0029059552|nr:protein HtrL-like [Ylistrum balloti]